METEMIKNMFDEFISRGGHIQVYKVSNTNAEIEMKCDPIMLYGKTGTGKTYLAGKLKREACEKGSCAVTVIATELVEEVVADIKRKCKYFSVDEFIGEYYIDTDVLVMEDMHELKDRELTQMLLAEMVMKLAEGGKQIIMTSTGSPEVLYTFNEYLENHGVRWFWI